MAEESKCLKLIGIVVSVLTILGYAVALAWAVVSIYISVALLEGEVRTLKTDLRRESGTIYLPSEIPAEVDTTESP